MNKSKIILLIIIFIATLLRFLQLGNVPVSLDWDESALGYNAYSLLKTGRDEYGKYLPVVLQSFGDYKPALYSYLTIPSIVVFGLTPFAVRFPSAIFGILTVLATYFLVKELFYEKAKLKRNYVESLALLSAFFLAISPWHIQFSRVAFESNIGLSLNVFAVLFFLKGLRNHKLFFLSALFAGLSIYVYQSEKVFMPLLMLLLVVIYWKKLFVLPKRYIAAAVVIGVVVILPMTLFIYTNKDSLARLKSVSVFTDTFHPIEDYAQNNLIDKQNRDPVGIIFDNRRIVYGKIIISNYLKHFDPNWLFIKGDFVLRHQSHSMGHLYIWELLFILIGIYQLIFSDFSKRTKLLLFGWIFITPIPASVTWDVPNAVRTLNFLPTFQILTALGVLSSYQFVNNRFHTSLLKQVILAVILFLGIFNVIYYLDSYFVQYNYYSSADWQYGYTEIIPTVNAIGGDYEKIVVGSELSLDQSYIFFLFNLKYPPEKYLAESKYISDKYKTIHSFGKYEFRHIDWQKENKNSKTLYIGADDIFPDSVSAIKTIYFLNGKKAIRIVSG